MRSNLLDARRASPTRHAQPTKIAVLTADKQKGQERQLPALRQRSR